MGLRRLNVLMVALDITSMVVRDVAKKCVHLQTILAIGHTSKTVWPSGLRRWLKAPFRKGVGSNPTAVIYVFLGLS